MHLKMGQFPCHNRALWTLQGTEGGDLLGGQSGLAPSPCPDSESPKVAPFLLHLFSPARLEF